MILPFEEELEEGNALFMLCHCEVLPPEVWDPPLIRKAGFSEKMTDKD